MKDYNLNILGLNVICWIKTGKFTYEGKTILFSERQDGFHHGSIAIILDGSDELLCVQSALVVDATVQWPCDGQANPFTCTCHKYTVLYTSHDHKDAEKDYYYQQLHEMVNNTPWHDITIFKGDMSAQMGGDRFDFKQVLGSHSYGKCTNNGNHFINFLDINTIKICSSLFQHKDIHKIIWISNDHKSNTQIVHCLFGNRAHMEDTLSLGCQSPLWI